MREDYLDRLSPEVQAFVREVEETSGVTIEIKLDACRAGRGPDGTGILACDIDDRGATLLVPSEEYFPDGGVVHEVLHIRRILVEGVPRLADNPDSGLSSPEVCQGLVNLDNALEHLIVVPEEFFRRPESAERWTRIMERICVDELAAMGNPHDQRRWTLLHCNSPTTAVLA